MSKDYSNRLQTDSRAENARSRMKKRGVNSARWASIIEQMAAKTPQQDGATLKDRAEQT